MWPDSQPHRKCSTRVSDARSPAAPGSRRHLPGTSDRSGPGHGGCLNRELLDRHLGRRYLRCARPPTHRACSAAALQAHLPRAILNL